MYLLSEVHEQEFKSASQFFEFISGSLITRDHTFGFRGHENAAWHLEPTISRYLEQIFERYPDWRDRSDTRALVLKRLHDSFKRNLIINGDISQSRIERMDLWQYGQHFGLPSPLLDWTYSPYIALFFALGSTSATRAEKRSVWAINMEMVQLLNRMVVEEVRPSLGKTIKSESLLNEQASLLEVVQEINESNKRIVYQQGFFTKHEYFKSLEIWLKRIVSELAHKKCNTRVLHKYTFECSESERNSILDKLDKMNINNRTLFPDISGSVLDATESTFRSFLSPKRHSYSFSQ